MKASVVSLALLAGLVAAQSDKIPSCATSCISKYTTGSGIAGCGQLDIKCICSNDDFLNGIACCLKDECDADGQAAAVKYAQQICSTAGVTVPDQVTCHESSNSASASASASASSSASASAASKSVAESKTAATEAESATKTASDETATAKSAASSKTASADESATTAAESTKSATESSSAAASTSSGAAVRGLDAAGGVMGAVMALFLAL